MSNVLRKPTQQSLTLPIERNEKPDRSERQDELIARHLEPHPARPGDDEWRLKERGVPVWAIIGSLTPTADNAEQIAHDYGVSHAAVAAALIYYDRHRSLIDARLAANRAA